MDRCGTARSGEHTVQDTDEEKRDKETEGGSCRFCCEKLMSRSENPFTSRGEDKTAFESGSVSSVAVVFS